MTSHELARLLLTLPDLPVATHADNHTYAVGCDAPTHGTLRVGLLQHYAGEHVIIGNVSKRNLSGPDYFVSELVHGEAPWEWWRPGMPLDETPEMTAQAEQTAQEWAERHRKRQARP